MPSSCPICHSGHRAPLGPRPNPPLRFRCSASASEEGRRSGRVKRWQERGKKQEEKNGEPFTTSRKKKKSLFAPHRQREAAALFLSRNLCSILRALSFPPSSHPPLKRNHTSRRLAPLLPHRITSVAIVVIQTANVKPAITQSVGFYVPPLPLFLPHAPPSARSHTLGYSPRITRQCIFFLFISVVITRYPNPPA